MYLVGKGEGANHHVLFKTSVWLLICGSYKNNVTP
jgi:hypothetical protein